MSLQQILSTGRSSLLAHQAAIATATNNTANADVVGFSKRDTHLVSLRDQGGVEVESVRRRADRFIEGRLLAEKSRLGTQSAQSEGLAALELQLGDFEGGIGGAMDQFFGALRALQVSPTEGQSRLHVVSSAQTLTDQFNVTAERIARERQQADGSLISAVNETNERLQALAELNETIGRAVANGSEPSHDLDRRDLLVGELSESLELTALPQADGTMTLLLAGGRVLVQGGAAAQLQAQPDSGLGGLARVDFVDSSGATTDMTSSIRGGRIGGLLELRDDILAETVARVDALAFDLATNVNAVHQAGFGLDGVGGRDFFVAPVAQAGAARTMAVAPGLVEDPGQIAAATTVELAVGGNDNVLALAGIADAAIANGNTATLGQEYASLLGSIGTTVAAHEQALRQSEVQVDQLQTIKDSRTGVSLDEELIDITRFERAFQAGSRIIQTAERMFDILLQI